MKNRKYKLLSYEVIEKAVARDLESTQYYTGYIKYLSYFQGHINDDVNQNDIVFLFGKKFSQSFSQVKN